MLDPYRGYATPDGFLVRARVLTRLRRTEPRPDASRLTNLLQMAGLFLTEEVAGVMVHAAGASGLSDSEGYVTLRVPAEAAVPGWTEVAVEVTGHPDTAVACPVLVPDPTAAFGVISDVDDTLVHTGAYSLARNLWTTFTGSALTRQVFPDAVELMAALSRDGRNPVFYVSSSPWNLHAFLDRVLGAAGIVRGPMLLRDLGLRGGDGGHKSHKGRAIDALMAANPRLGFVLVGDTGQKDAEIYRAAAERHPGRVLGVILRAPRARLAPATEAAIAALQVGGIPVHHAENFAAAPRDWSVSAGLAGLGAAPDTEAGQARLSG